MTRPRNRSGPSPSLQLGLVFTLVLLCCHPGRQAFSAEPFLSNPAPGPHVAPEYRFVWHEIPLGFAERQTVLTGFLLGGAVGDVAVVWLDGAGGRRLRIHAHRDGVWTPKVEATLGPEVLFVDVVGIAGQDRLVTFSAGQIKWFDPVDSSERPLLSLPIAFSPPRTNEIPHVDIARDLNGDGLDDFVAPGANGFLVAAQTPDGCFADPVEIGPVPDLSRILGADGYRYDPWSQSRVFEMDHDGDGRGDLVYWDGDGFAVHKQDARGLFEPLAGRFSTGVAFDSDRMDFVGVGLAGRVLDRLADVNGDGIGDLVVYSLEGGKIADKGSKFEVHFGVGIPGGGIRFSDEIGLLLETKDEIQISLEIHDFDRDGKPELMVGTIPRTLLVDTPWKRLKGFFGGDVWQNLQFYRGPWLGGKPEPVATRRSGLEGVAAQRKPGSIPLEIALRGATHERRRTQTSWRLAFNSTLLIGDLTGDGRSELLLGSHPIFLDLHLGAPGPGLFWPRPQILAVAPPNDMEHTWLVDLNKDGKDDLLMHHPFTLKNVHGARKLPPGAEAHRIAILLSL